MLNKNHCPSANIPLELKAARELGWNIGRTPGAGQNRSSQGREGYTVGSYTKHYGYCGNHMTWDGNQPNVSLLMVFTLGSRWLTIFKVYWGRLLKEITCICLFNLSFAWSQNEITFGELIIHSLGAKIACVLSNCWSNWGEWSNKRLIVLVTVKRRDANLVQPMGDKGTTKKVTMD